MPTHPNTIAPIGKIDLFSRLPPEWDDPTLFVRIQDAVRRSRRKVIVLDDDPTGTQTVHDVDILTRWPVERLREALSNRDTACYILTNSRSLAREPACALNEEIAANLVRAARETGQEFVLVSRSDSTLRGHYPAEITALSGVLERSLGKRFDGHIVIPFFLEGGRFTVNDIHWVQDGAMLLPAGQTEYARDSVFGYQSSDLREWVVEKGDGQFSPSDVVSIPLDTLRRGGPDQVASILGNVRGGRPVILNCASYADLRVFVAGLLEAEAKGKHFLYRTGASFVKVRSAIQDQPLLTPQQLGMDEQRTCGGLTVVGSYNVKSSAQLNALQKVANVTSVELRVDRVLADASRTAEIDSAARAIDQAIKNGRDGLVFTSRGHVIGRTKEETLEIAQKVSGSLVRVIQQTRVVPRYLIAKGGITSSDMATKGLAVERARVLGQIAPGVPVWRLGSESRYPGVPFIVFPGNVGESNTLAQIVETLKG